MAEEGGTLQSYIRKLLRRAKSDPVSGMLAQDLLEVIEGIAEGEANARKKKVPPMAYTLMTVMENLFRLSFSAEGEVMF